MPWLLAIPALLGLFLLIRGLRGRRMDDHPLCRRCGYDLNGLYAPVSCPECGRSLSQQRAVRFGHRRKRWFTLSCGLMLLLLSLGGGGLAMWSHSRNFNWNTIKPLWLLRNEAASVNPGTRAAARKEILARINANGLSKSQIDDLVAQSLALQVDASKAWDPWWGDVFEAAWAGSLVSDARFKQYLTTAIDGAMYLRMRPAVHANIPTRIDVMLRSPRTGSPGVSNLFLESRGVSLLIDGQPAIELRNGCGVGMAHWTESFEQNLVVATEQLNLPIGSHRIGVETNFTIRDANPLSFNWSPPQQLSKSETLTLSRIVESTIEIIPDDERRVRLMHDESMSDAMNRSIIPEFRTQNWESAQPMLFTYVNFNRPPANVAFEVILRERASGREWPLGTVWSEKAGGQTMALKLDVDERNDWILHSSTLELVFRPSTAAAEETWSLFEVWNGELRHFMGAVDTPPALR